MKKFIKENGIEILVDMCVLIFAEMIMNYLKIENMWIQIGVLTLALLLADAIYKFLKK